MRYFFLFPFCFFSLCAMDIAQVEHLLSSLQNFSKTQSLDTLENLPNPFENSPIHTQDSLKLYAIINKKALVNGEWLSKGESIQGYIILDIQDQYIIAQKGKIQKSIIIGEGIETEEDTQSYTDGDKNEKVGE